MHLAGHNSHIGSRTDQWSLDVDLIMFNLISTLSNVAVRIHLSHQFNGLLRTPSLRTLISQLTWKYNQISSYSSWACSSLSPMHSHRISSISFNLNLLNLHSNLVLLLLQWTGG